MKAKDWKPPINPFPSFNPDSANMSRYRNAGKGQKTAGIKNTDSQKKEQPSSKAHPKQYP
jgi:hypothetical protein